MFTIAQQPVFNEVLKEALFANPALIAPGREVSAHETHHSGRVQCSDFGLILPQIVFNFGIWHTSRAC